jgi:hypothetical protein
MGGHRGFLLLLLSPAALAKLPYDPLTHHISHDCWAPDYCEPEHFYYRLCKLRLRGRAKTLKSQYECPEGEYCEELDCPGHNCWLPPQCWCMDDGHHEGRMFCTDDGCYNHASTQWGLCRKEPEDHELPEHGHPDEEEHVLPTGFHFWTQDELLYNPKLHIDEGHNYSRPREPKYTSKAHVPPHIREATRRPPPAPTEAKDEL